MQRPDTFYGLTKTFTENLASLYWDKFGVESVMLRICSCFEAPRDRRMLWSWLSFDDCVRLVTAALTAPARRLLGDLRHLRQRRAAPSRTPTPATSASARRTAPTAMPRQ